MIFFFTQAGLSSLSPGMPNVVLRLITAGKPLEGHDGIVYSDACSPDGSTLSPDPSVAFSPYGKCTPLIRLFESGTPSLMLQFLKIHY